VNPSLARVGFPANGHERRRHRRWQGPEGTSISFGPLASTRMACPEEIMNSERAYVAALGSASWWSASENELVLSDSSAQELLRYEPATT
jgi:heat shock protein HslJ